VPNHTRDVHELLRQLPIDGVILSGGNDLSDTFIGRTATNIRNPSPRRDALEKSLLEAAIRQGLPVLGICRGMQFINVFFGGGITQDIETELPAADNHVAQPHPIVMADKTAVEITGSDRFDVNSYHHQGVRDDQVAGELVVFARQARDRMVEGLYHPRLPVAGIQWHPEREGNSPEENLRLIRAFLSRKGFWETAP
jgi:putative glutamine amidotransferase